MKPYPMRPMRRGFLLAIIQLEMELSWGCRDDNAASFFNTSPHQPKIKLVVDFDYFVAALTSKVEEYEEVDHGHGSGNE